MNWKNIIDLIPTPRVTFKFKGANGLDFDKENFICSESDKLSGIHEAVYNYFKPGFSDIILTVDDEPLDLNKTVGECNLQDKTVIVNMIGAPEDY